MALKKCKECEGQVSSKATACPHCGAVLKKERQSIGCGGLILILIIIGSLSSIIGGNDSSTSRSSSSTKQETQKPKTKAEIRTERISKGFSAWDGSHRGLEKVIKASMNDPDSYDHVETTYWDKGDHLIVKTTFRGKNAFGGVVKNWVKGKADLDGNIIAVLEQGP
jgi:hypothetical protein